MSLFSSLPIRSNAGRVFASWWNDIRSALVAAFGDAALGETSFTIANNTSSAADVTGALFSSSECRSAVLTYDVRRQTDTASSEVRARGRLYLQYRYQTTTWEVAGQEETGDDHGVAFTVTAAGQVQYTSTDISGANYVGELRFKAEAFND